MAVVVGDSGGGDNSPVDVTYRKDAPSRCDPYNQAYIFVSSGTNAEIQLMQCHPPPPPIIFI